MMSDSAQFGIVIEDRKTRRVSLKWKNRHASSTFLIYDEVDRACGKASYSIERFAVATAASCSDSRIEGISTRIINHLLHFDTCPQSEALLLRGLIVLTATIATSPSTYIRKYDLAVIKIRYENFRSQFCARHSHDVHSTQWL